MGFINEYNLYVKKYNIQPDTNTKIANPQFSAPNVTEGEAIIFWENGLAPAKDQITLTFSATEHWFYTSYMEDGQLVDIILPIPLGFNVGTVNAIAIPKYRKRESFYTNAAIVTNNKEIPFQLGEDFYPIAKQCLHDRMLREIVNIVTRFASKKAASEGLAALSKSLLGDNTKDGAKVIGDIAGAITEKADTRNWQSLPGTISYIRIPLKEGQTEYTIKKYGPQGIVDTDTITIPFKKGLQIVNYFDLGRTQVIPAGAQTPTASTVNSTSDKP